MRYILFFALLPLMTSSLGAQTSAWEPMNRGLGHTLVYTLAIDPVDSLRMFCGTDVGQVYESVDGGFNWLPRSQGLPETYSSERLTGLYQHPFDRDLLYAGYSGRKSEKMLYHSANGGATWQLINTPTEWTSGGILHIHYVSGPPAQLYCGLGWWHGLYTSSNNGNTWTQLLSDAAIQTIGVHPEHPSIILVGCSGKQTLLRSSNAGNTWVESHSGIDGRNGQSGVRAITFSPSSPDVVYIGVTGPGAGLYRSVDAGMTWTKLNGIGEISGIAVHPHNEDLIYISAIHDGVRRSTNRGATWVQVNEGLPTTDVMRVRIAPGYPIRVFAVTLEHGAFRMVDEELPQSIGFR